MLAIAISYFVIIVAVSISSGFRNELRKAISKMAGDVAITRPDMSYTSDSEPLENYPRLRDEISSIPGVSTVTPVVYRAGIIKNAGEIGGALFKGTPDGGDSLGVSVPASLSKSLGLSDGDELLTYYIGEKVRARRFKISSIYEDIAGLGGNQIVFANIKDMQRLNSWTDDEVSAIEVKLEKIYSTPERMENMADEIGSRILISDGSPTAPVALSAVRRYPQIFSWLDLIDRNVLVILILMTIVAGFNMVSGLLILLFQRISTIGCLKALGMTDKSIARIFLRVSSSLVLKSMALGNLLALGLCAIQGCTQILKLNPENYFVSYVPVHVNMLTVLAVDLLSYLAIMGALLIPSVFVSRVDPALTIRTK